MHTNDKSKNKSENAANGKYDKMTYNRCGNSGVLLPSISLGLWHNFGAIDDFDNAQDILKTAFELGIVHFDLANNYGPPYGSTEQNFGKILKNNFSSHRDELFISTKAGYDMWPGPYGNWGSRKYLISSLEQSLKRMNLDYVDVFYHHRPDPDTPLEETMLALADIVRQGKALYVGISNYNATESDAAFKLLKELRVPVILHQARYSMFDRWVEDELLDVLDSHAVGCIAFSPLAQGLLTNTYIHGIPENSRAVKSLTYLEEAQVHQHINKIKSLNEIAERRQQKLSQMAIAWLLRKPQISSVLVGASSSSQLKENVKSLDNNSFSMDELNEIDAILMSN